jgi:threonine synthase
VSIAQKRWHWPFQCGGCGKPYPQSGFPFRCPDCGAPYDLPEITIHKEVGTSIPGIGMRRFRHALPLPPKAEFISLGEGDTPLVPLTIQGRVVHFKCEQLNPTGSFKDRGTAVLVSALSYAGMNEVVEDSSGNAGASLAAYAAYAGIKARVFVPAYASGPKRRQIEAYGAQVVAVEGPRSEATEAVLNEVEKGAIYASHAYHPHGLAGMATIGFELLEQLRVAPATVLMPVGQGSLILGLDLGFRALLKAGRVKRLPQLIGVQARACAPIWNRLHLGSSDLGEVMEGNTMAEGIRTQHPLRLERVLQVVERSKGDVVAVEEGAILDGFRQLATRGLYVEPTSAVVWPALMALWEKICDPVVVILSGSGLKSSPV